MGYYRVILWGYNSSNFNWSTDYSCGYFKYPIPFTKCCEPILVSSGWYSANSITIVEVISQYPDNEITINPLTDLAVMMKSVHQTNGLIKENNAGFKWIVIGV